MDRAHRLRSAADFRRTFAEGRRGACGAIVAVVRREPAADRAPRIGITAGKAVGSAVARNRVKRRLRAIAATALPRIPAGTDVVLVAKAESSGKDFQHLEADVIAALGKVGIA